MNAVAALPARWRNLAEGFRNGTDIGNAEAACLVVTADELDAALAAAPAPVAGDAVAWINYEIDTTGGENNGRTGKRTLSFERIAAGHDWANATPLAALAQDRASQGPAPVAVPEWFEDVRRCLDDVATQQRAHGYGDGRMVQLLARMAAWQGASQ